MRQMSKIYLSRNPEHFEKFKVGDSVAVRSINPYNLKRMITFTGVCLAKHRKGVDSSFLLRNNIDSCGVEQLFAYFNPLIQVGPLHLRGGGALRT